MDKLILEKKDLLFHPVTFMDIEYEWKFSVVSYGVFRGGTPAAIVFTNCSVPIYIELGNYSISCDDAIEKQKEIINLMNQSKYKTRFVHSIVRKKSIEGFQPDNGYFLEIIFNNAVSRASYLKIFENNGYRVFNNDKSLLHRNVWSKYQLYASGWLQLQANSYKRIYNDDIHKGITIEIDINKVTNVNNPDEICLKQSFKSAAWDIESFTYGDVGKIQTNRIKPDENGTNYDVVFMISYSLKWLDGDYIKNYILTTLPCTKDGKEIKEHIVKSKLDIKDEKEVEYPFDIIVCKDQIELIFTFFKLIAQTRPNILMDFNGSSFDWPMIINRLKHFRMLETVLNMVKHSCQNINYYSMKFGPQSEEVKIKGSEKLPAEYFGFLDCITADILLVLKKDFQYSSGDESNIQSLNGFLEHNKIPLKKDMNYSTLREIYQNKDTDKNLLVAEYCMYDSICLHILNEKRNTIQGIKSICNETYSALFVGIHNADGVKILNRFRKHVYEEGYVYRLERDISPRPQPFGAIVLEPNRGLHVYNIFDYDSYSPELQDEIKKKDISFRQESIDRNDKYIHELQCPNLIKELEDFRVKYPPLVLGTHWVADRLSAAIDYRSLYPSVIREKNLCKSTLINPSELDILINKFGYKGEDFNEHTFSGELKYTPKHYGKFEKMGLIPKMLSQLFDRRMEIKKLSAEAYKRGDKYAADILTCQDKAVKLVLNTTYGLTGEKENQMIRSNYIFQGTCNLGRYYLLIAKIFCEHFGCVINYGDTDSNYGSAPETCFTEIDQKYKNREITHEEYIQGMIEITDKYWKEMCMNINKMLKEFSYFLAMAFEETLLGCFIQAKNYWGLNINELPYKKFIEKSKDPNKKAKIIKSFLQKGIPTRKKDKSQFQKLYLYDFMIKCLQPNLKISPVEIARNQILEIKDANIDKKLFMSFATYKKGTATGGSKTHKPFVRNMKLWYDIEIPDLHKFKYYIIIRPDQNFDINGKRVKAVGERMCLASIVKRDNLELDRIYYIEKYIKTISIMIKFKFNNDNEMAAKYLMQYLNLDKTEKRKETCFNSHLIKTYKNEKYYITDISLNIKMLQDNNAYSTLINDILLQINNEYFDTPCLKIVSNSFRVFENPNLIQRKKILRDLIESKIEYLNDLLPSTLTFKKHTLNTQYNKFEEKINQLLGQLMANKERYIQIIKDHYNSLVSNIISARKEYRETKDQDSIIKKQQPIKIDLNTIQEIKDLKNNLTKYIKKFTVLYIVKEELSL